jgi:outer membrane protein OmpA-like peptidoglycan-associated protein
MTSRGLEFILDDRFFKKDSSKLLISSIRVIDKITDFLREHPDKNILIEGYMNSEKSSSYNLDLSLRRANEVARMLTAQGVSKRRIETKGLGDKESKSEVDIVVKN